MTLLETEPPSSRRQVTRARSGRVLGGVCAGLGPILGVQAWHLRAAFIAAALIGGLGLVLYLACWWILPLRSELTQPANARGVAVLALALGSLVGLLVLCVVAAALTVIGYGWVALVLATALLLAPLAARLLLGDRIPRAPASAQLLVTAGLCLPAMGVALSGIRLPLQSGATVTRPASAAAIGHTVFRSGFDTLLIDLRHTQLPHTGTVHLRIDAGLRHTTVALPEHQCVHVRLVYRVNTFPGRFATLLDGHRTAPFDYAILFGRMYGVASARSPNGTASSRGARGGVTLDVSFRSQGGGLYVRDYPDSVNPQLHPDWPGFIGPLEPRPYLAGEPHRLIPKLLREWRARRRAQRASRRLVTSLMPGPCAR